MTIIRTFINTFRLSLVVVVLAAALFTGMQLTAGVDQAGAFKEDSHSISSKSTMDKLKQQIKERVGIEAEIKSVRESELNHLYEVIVDNKVIYVSKDFSFLLIGSLYQIENGEIHNLSHRSLEKSASSVNNPSSNKLSEIGTNDGILFKAPNERYTINVFTDVDCLYCRRFHENINDYLKLGISVRYYGYSMTGAGSHSFDRLTSIWCAADRAKALNEASINKVIAKKTCKAPLTRMQAIGKELGIGITPAIVTDKGEVLQGVPNALELVQQLNKETSFR